MDPNPESPIEAAQGPALSLRSVTKAFGGLVAVDGIDLDVVHGQRLGLLGPNGAGKTTLFNLVAGDMRPTSGTIEIGGVDCTMLASRHRAAMGVARTYQRTRLFGGLTVTDNLYLAQTGKSGRHRALWKSEEDELLREKAAAAAAKVWLGKRKDDTVDDLSHGERRQLEVAMALVTEPSILLLDEPASGLSQGERENLTQLLLGLPRVDSGPHRARHGCRPPGGRANRGHVRWEDGGLGHDGGDPATPSSMRSISANPAKTDGRPTAPGRHAPGRVWPVDGPRRALLLDGNRVGGDHRAQRHGEDDPVQGDHGTGQADPRRWFSTATI